MRGFMKDVFFETAFTQDAVPSYRCPVCMEGDLIKEEFVSESTAVTKKNSENDWWEPDYDEYVFRLTLKCPRCNELVFVHGDGYVDQEITMESEDEWTRAWVCYYRPKNFFPPLKFIKCPVATPRTVQESLGSAAALYYSHPSAACNYLRMAAEDILTSLGVPSSTPEEYVSLAQRIKKLDNKSAEYLLLDAVRWLGNVGSHSGSTIKHEDAKDAFSLIDLLIEEIYSDRKKKIHELAEAIRTNKGPVSSRGF
ncbi:DUF4145 domain-containing protein [Pseudomonas aeruginosa]|nr:DUF4145 domain-containing protein [Pseudomonas aeruginosa]